MSRETLTEAKKPIIAVAAAVIINDACQVLLSKRHADAHQGGKWEFPGGKLEPTESPREALHREIKEELDIMPTQVSEYLHLTHQYPEKQVMLHIFLVQQFSGTPRGCERQEVRWFDLSMLEDLEFPDANYAILDRLKCDYGH